ncbi:MAG: hypothetical protein QOE46_234 [Acidobacteriota bacterium]|jgi:hypothetical protein|nr:hypothetical protein [Acidobacteriota bacterium]
MSDAAAREQTDTETGAAVPGLRVPFSATTQSPSVRRSLAVAVFAKLTLDLIFVGVLAVYAHAVAFNASCDGALDHADAQGVSGWVSDSAHPGASVEVQLYVDGNFAGAGLADTAAQGSATKERLGFDFKPEPLRPGEHEARVYAVHTSRGDTRRTLQQIGNPLRFVLK